MNDRWSEQAPLHARVSLRPVEREKKLQANVALSDATWIFDLDNTLYPADCNLFSQVDQRMGEFIARYLGVPFEYARHLQKTYYRQFGTTLSGLMQVHKMDPKAFLDYVHDIDLSVVAEHPELAQAIEELPAASSSSPTARARMRSVWPARSACCTVRGIFDIVDAAYVPKPVPVRSTSS